MPAHTHNANERGNTDRHTNSNTGTYLLLLMAVIGWRVSSPGWTYDPCASKKMRASARAKSGAEEKGLLVCECGHECGHEWKAKKRKMEIDKHAETVSAAGSEKERQVKRRE